VWSIRLKCKSVDVDFLVGMCLWTHSLLGHNRRRTLKRSHLIKTLNGTENVNAMASSLRKTQRPKSVQTPAIFKKHFSGVFPVEKDWFDTKTRDVFCASRAPSSRENVRSKKLLATRLMDPFKPAPSELEIRNRDSDSEIWESRGAKEGVERSNSILGCESVGTKHEV